ncbi:MAG TPA: two-component regulator propeller domain-containing protein, partial [Verrucomicrobiota bacterium]|nr:two-component regulator propeller domain-containing protein [Verrucomicrobiota bacterium]
MFNFKYNSDVIRTLLIVIFLTTSSLFSAERNYIRRVFRASDGLRETQVTSVSVSPRGTVWARHGELGVLSYLDGYNIRHIPAPPGNYKIYESKTGQIWSLYSDGLQEYDGTKWVSYSIPEISEEFSSAPVRRIRQIPLIPTKKGEVFFLISKGLMAFDVEKKSVSMLLKVEQTRLEKFIDMIPSDDDGIWITGKKGILKLSPDIFKDGTIAFNEFLFDEKLNVENGLRPVEDEIGGITLVADSLETGKRVSIFFDGKKWHKILSLDESIRQSWRDIHQTFWGLTINRLIKLRNFPDLYIERDVLNLGQMFEIAFAKCGVFYAATIDGLYRFAPALWIQESVLGDINSPVHSINQTTDDKFWFITSDGLGLFFKNKWKMHSFEEGMEQIFQPQGSPYFIGSDLMVLNISDRAHFFNPKSEEFIPIEHPSGRYSKLVGQLKDGSICLLTVDPTRLEGGYRIDIFDGKRFRHFMEATNTVRLGSDLFFVKQVSNGDVWVGGSTAIAVFKNKQWIFFGQDSILSPPGATCMVEIETNKLWFALQNNIYEYDGKYWRIIKGDLGNIRSILKSSSGAVWVATGNGLFRYEKGRWISNSTQEGLPSSSIFTLFEDKSGKLWTGTSRGVATFNPEADTAPPSV